MESLHTSSNYLIAYSYNYFSMQYSHTLYLNSMFLGSLSISFKYEIYCESSLLFYSISLSFLIVSSYNSLNPNSSIYDSSTNFIALLAS